MIDLKETDCGRRHRAAPNGPVTLERTSSLRSGNKGRWEVQACHPESERGELFFSHTLRERSEAAKQSGRQAPIEAPVILCREST